MKTILVTAYAVNPYKGSEDGTGWNMSCQIAKENKAIIITRKNNQEHIEDYIQEFPDAIYDNMSFQYFDLPLWAMWWKKKIGERGYVIYYYLWQLFMPLFILKQKLQFDIAHCLNFHSDSHPHFLWTLGKPVFWGPVGHHPKVPKAFIKDFYGNGAYFKDRVYQIVKWCMRRLDPFYHLAVVFSEKIFVINSSVPTVMRARLNKVITLSAVAAVKPVFHERAKNSAFTVLSVGRFTYMKGFDITINAFISFMDGLPIEKRNGIRLKLVGKGEEESRLKQLADASPFSNHIDFVSWVPLNEMGDLYRNSDAFLFPSHEGAGMVVPEAMSYGLPVICFDNAGPGELVGDVGLKVSYDESYNEVVNGFSVQLNLLFENISLKEELSRKSLSRFDKVFTWDRKGEIINQAYDIEVDQKKKATCVAVFHPSSELYGADRILVNALKAYPEAVRKNVYLYSNGPLVKFLEEQVPNIHVQIDTKLPFIHRSVFTPVGIVSFFYRWIKFIVYFRRESKKYFFKSIYFNTLACSFMLPVAYVMKLRSLVHVHEIIESPKLVGWLTAFLCSLFANRVVAVSQAVEDKLLEYVASLKVKLIVIHNGIEGIEVPPKKPGEKIQFYLFGRIMEKKGHWFLIEALRHLPKNLLNKSQFTLMGGAVPGQEQKMEELTLLISSYGLQEHVRIKSFAKDISTAMTIADVCLVPSMMKDPFPTTVLEAMSAGKPVIATNHGGAKEAIKDSTNGFLIGKGDTENLAHCIKRLINDTSSIEAYGRDARNTFEQRFTKSVFEKNWKALLERSSFA